METIAQTALEMIGGVLAILMGIVIYVGILYMLSAILKYPARYIGKTLAKLRKPSENYNHGDKGSKKEWWRLIITVTLTLTVTTLLYSLILKSPAKYSALFFVGLPIVLALSVFLLPKSQSRYINMAKLVTVFLGISYWVFGEGLICVLMAAPLFYAAGAVVVASYEGVNKAASPAVIGLVLLVCLEGIHPALSFDREHSASAEDIVPLSVAEVRANLAGNPDLRKLPLDFMLRLGFPVPHSAIGTGISTGDIREFMFKRRDGVLETVRFKVVFGDASQVQLLPVFDDTVISQWLRWQGTQIHWEAVTENTTKISVTMQFERHLDPVWYFAPLQKWVVGKAAGVLIQHAGMKPVT